MSNIVDFDPRGDNLAIGHSSAIDAIIAKSEGQPSAIEDAVDAILDFAGEPEHSARALLIGFVTELLDLVQTRKDGAA